MEIKNSQKFSEMEFCITRYFGSNITPIMESTERYLVNKCQQEDRQYKQSLTGLLRSVADESHSIAGVDSSSLYLRTFGEWNSKTTDDYLDMVRQKIVGDKSIQKDLVVMADEWRKTVIEEIGREAYDEASKQIGADLSYAYIEYRLEQQMIDHLAAQRAPASTIEYILAKAADQSLFGMANDLKKTATDFQIQEKADTLYAPSVIEQGAARALAFGVDTIVTTGVCSWSSIARMAGVEVVFAGIEYACKNKNDQKTMSVEECISRGLFQSPQNVFTDFRTNASRIQPWEHPDIIKLNHCLNKRMQILEEEPIIKPFFMQKTTDMSLKWTPSNQSDRSDIPSFIAFGKEDEYRAARKKQEMTARQEAAKKEEKETSSAEETNQQTPNGQGPSSDISESPVPLSATNTPESNLSGWGSLLNTFGLTDISKVGGNLGYVISMLPDVLFGALTGKTSNLTLDKNLLPLASILLGTFVRNPLLKMTLLGLGGANLMNKAGHEVLDNPSLQIEAQPTVQYRHYANEALNPRITDPVIKGNAMLCMIDRKSCVVTLPDTTLAAYKAGALPLNTLANAILARHDETQQALEENIQRQYEETARQHNKNQGIR